MSAKDEADDDARAVVAAFKEAVNMTPAALERWLASDASKAVGVTHEGEHESVGHHSGRRIVGLLRKRAGAFDHDDLEHMNKVVGYVKRHLAQRPHGDVTDTRWRCSLMNWGHDPLK